MTGYVAGKNSYHFLSAYYVRAPGAALFLIKNNFFNCFYLFLKERQGMSRGGAE